MVSEIAQSQFSIQEEAKEEKDYLLKLTSLKNSKEFEKASLHATSFAYSCFKVLSSKSFSKISNNNLIYLGFKITKKITRSVGRNKIKRRLKSIFRKAIINNEDLFFKHQSFIIIARREILNFNFKDLEKETLKFLKFFKKKLSNIS